MQNDAKILDAVLNILNEGDFDDVNELILTEGAIYDNTNSKDKVKITLHMDGMPSAADGYLMDPYIKIYDGPFSNHTGTARLSMKDCKVIHHNVGKEPELKLNKKILDQINLALKSQSNIGKHKGMSVYDAFYEEIADRFGKNKVIKYPFPDVTKTYDIYANGTMIEYLYYGKKEKVKTDVK